MWSDVFSDGEMKKKAEKETDEEVAEYASGVNKFCKMWKKSGINVGKCGQRVCMTGCRKDRNMIRYQGQKV